MKKIFLFLIFSLIHIQNVHASCFDSLKKDFFSQFPNEGSVTLSTGEVVNLPTHFIDAEGINVIGTVSLEYAERNIKNKNLKPMILPGNRVLAFFTLILTKEHDFGPHNDFGVNIIVKSEDSKVREDSRGPRLALANTAIATDLFGDLPISNQADREVWGLKKSDVQFRIKEEGSRRLIEMGNADGTIMVLDFEISKFIPAVPLVMKTFIYSVADQTRVAPTFFKGKFKMQPGASHGSIYFNKNHEDGARLTSMDFRPLIWQYSSHIQGVYLREVDR